MSTFVAIDFETADPKRDSACAIGLVRVEAGRIVYRESALIRPPRGMSAVCQAVHGLTWDDVKGAPPFAAVWPKVLPVIAGATALVAHNAPFDRSVLSACCTAARIAPPPHDWVCTLALAKKRWRPPATNRLPDVCSRLGIDFANHHEAGADAEAAARVYLALTGAPPPPPAPADVWVPSGPCGPILDRIPPEHRSPAVVNLMRDAEALGPEWATDLVRYVRAWHARPDPGRPHCPCGDRCSLICDRCTACILEFL